MSYTPPVGNNIQFIFTLTYNEPTGHNIVFDFILSEPVVSSTNFNFTNSDYTVPIATEIEFWFLPTILTANFPASILNTTSNLRFAKSDTLFNFISDGYTPPLSTEIEFWFLSITTITFPASILNVSNNAQFIYVSDCESISTTQSNLYHVSDIIFDFGDSHGVSVFSSLLAESDSWALFDFAPSIVETQSSLYFGQDKFFDFSNNVINTTSNMNAVYDVVSNFEPSILNTSYNISYAIYCDINSTLNTTSSFVIKELINNDNNYLVNIGYVISNYQYKNTLQESIIIDCTYFNGFSIDFDFNYFNSFTLSSNNIIINNLYETIEQNFNNYNTLLNIVNSNHVYQATQYIASNNLYPIQLELHIKHDYEYNNTLLNIVNSDFNYDISMFIHIDNIILNSIRQNIINAFDYNNSFSLFSNNLLIINDNQYYYDFSNQIINDIEYNNTLLNIVNSDFNYNVSMFIYVDNIILNSIKQNIINDIEYNNTLFNIINSDINYDISMFIHIDNIILNSIRQNIINAFDYNNSFSLFSNNLLIINDNQYYYDFSNQIINDIEYNNTLLNIVNSDFNYNVSMFIYVDNIILNSIKQNIINDIEYNNTLFNIINSDINYDISMFIHIDNIILNSIRQNIINAFDYNNSFSLFSNNLLIINDNQYYYDFSNQIINDNLYNNLLSNNLLNDLSYKNGLSIINYHSYNNTIAMDLLKDNTHINNLTTSMILDFSFKNDLLLFNIISSNNKVSYYLGSDSSIYTENTIQAYINNQVINIINCNIEIDDESYGYNFSAEVASLQDWFLCIPKNEITITLNSNIYKFIIDSRSRTREFNSDKYIFAATSKTSILNSNVVTKTYESVLATEVIQELCNENNITYQYNMLDWNIPSGLLTADKESPINIMQRLADACGGIIICDNLGNLKFTTKYPISPLLYNSSVDSFNDYDNIFNISESTEIKDKWNAAVISNITESTDYSYNISEISDLENNIYTKHLRVKVYPYLEQIDLLTSFISNGILIKSYNNPITEIIRDEIVEIIEGKGSTSDSIKQIVSYEYLNTNLGTLLFNNNEITTQIYGQSLIKITYKTEYHDFILYNGLQTSNIQVYTTDNEVI